MPTLSGALWMPLGNLGRALRTDFPVLGRPHTFSLPTIYKVGQAVPVMVSNLCPVEGRRLQTVDWKKTHGGEQGLLKYFF